MFPAAPPSDKIRGLAQIYQQDIRNRSRGRATASNFSQKSQSRLGQGPGTNSNTFPAALGKAATLKTSLGYEPHDYEQQLQFADHSEPRPGPLGQLQADVGQGQSLGSPVGGSHPGFPGFDGQQDETQEEGINFENTNTNLLKGGYL